DRICLKALVKRSSDGYQTALALAEDLRHFEQFLLRPSRVPGGPPEPRAGSVMPKGLRSFDANDADFFLGLLPGPRDRDGLPESVRFWKARIEETDPAKTFTVGLLYGPSGCGKSSLVKAGLLPRLADHVVTVYVEATAAETETRLLNGLRKRFSGLSENLALVESLTNLRRNPFSSGRVAPQSGIKVLVV